MSGRRSTHHFHTHYYQEKFAKDDKVGDDDRSYPFNNILDKGYRIIKALWRAGKQVCSLNNVWLAWSFQVNFMYASVL